MGRFPFLHLLVVAAAITTCQSQASGNTTIPLSAVRNSGVLNVIQKGPLEFMNKFLSDSERRGFSSRRFQHLTVSTGNSSVKVVGAQNLSNISKKERSENIERMMPHAGCDIYDTVVEIPNNRPDVLMYPACVVVKQCGGCCGHPSLSCKPTRTEPKLVQVVQYVYDGTNISPAPELTYMQVEEHKACECMCKVQANDCSRLLHDYNENECQCKCKNEHLSGTCPANKRWNPKICGCQCANIINCGNGYLYSMDSCSCVEEVSRSSGINPGGPGEVDVISNAEEIEIVEVTENPCSHMRCPRGYEAVPKAGGRCGCIYVRRRG